MEILLTNDDGYRAKGIGVLAEIMSAFGNVTVVAPKHHQSGMGMAVSMNGKALAYKEIGRSKGVTWSYLDATPASCVKFGLSNIFADRKPDVVISGINHGSNAATAACYSGTLGAVSEAAVNDVPGIGVSLDTWDPDANFSAVEKYFPDLFSKIMSGLPHGYGIYYNINFPGKERGPVKGIRTASQGLGRWIKEFETWDPDLLERYGISRHDAETAMAKAEPGEKLYLMTGEFIDDPRNPRDADHRFNHEGYITIVPHNINCTDFRELERLRRLNMDVEFHNPDNA